MWRKTLWGVAVLVVLLTVIGYRTLSFVPVDIEVDAAVDISLDETAADRLAEAIRYRTISAETDEERRNDAFKSFHVFLAQQFPLTHNALVRETVNDYGLLYTWAGSDADLKPLLLLSHQDVVPIEPGTEKDWHYAPFSGEIADGYIWGRGAWDDKSTLMASLEAVEMLLRQGVQPQRTIMLAFGHDEETGGDLGAVAIAAELDKRGLEFEFILDEGATIAKGIIQGISDAVAMVGIAEKGYLTIELTARGSGGHSSAPPNITAVGKLAQAVHRLQQQPLPAALNQPVRAMFEVLGPHMSWDKRLVLANLWLFEPLMVHRLASQRSTNPYVRTTTAPTMLQAGVKENVLPQAAQATVNFRIVPGQTRAEVISQVKQIINDDEVEVRQAGAIGSEPSQVSNPESFAFQQIRKSILQVMPDLLVSPALLFGATDSRHYSELSDQIFRFTPISMGPEDVKRIHGTNERISIVDYENAIRFYYQLISNTALVSE